MSGISLEEFQKLQGTLLEYKQQAYDAEAAMQKLRQALAESQKSAPSGSSSWFSGSSKQTEALQQDNDNLRRSVSQLKEEFAAQTEALKGNIRSLYEETEALQETIKAKNNLITSLTPTEPAPSPSLELQALVGELKKSLEIGRAHV